MQIIAMIAYLQRLGTDINKPDAPAGDSKTPAPAVVKEKADTKNQAATKIQASEVLNNGTRCCFLSRLLRLRRNLADDLCRGLCSCEFASLVDQSSRHDAHGFDFPWMMQP